MLEVRELEVGYPHPAMVRNLSFRVEQREAVCLIGPNGAGKTTSLRGVMGLAERLGGKVLIDDVDVTSRTTEYIVGLGLAYVPEGRHIFPNLTVEENLTAAMVARGIGRSRSREILDRTYEQFPTIAARRKNPGGALSGGQQQLLAIARALAQQPRILLVDEPTVGLSPVAVEEVASVLSGLVADGLSLLLVEQNVDFALGLCDRGYVLVNGEVAVANETAEALRSAEVAKELYFG